MLLYHHYNPLKSELGITSFAYYTSFSFYKANTFLILENGEHKCFIFLIKDKGKFQIYAHFFHITELIE